ncbi:MAG: hypothetical protein HY286_15460 [Planctomycetes bacterium]|nr:hypothetical protein [Planctomycetota bacterium]
MIAAAAILFIYSQSAPASGPASNLASVEIEARAPDNAVKFGAPFPLEIVRTWDERDPAPPWRDSALAPLVVTARDVKQSAANHKITETRSFEARAFARDELNIPELHLHVKIASALDDPAGAVEEPPGPLPAPFPWRTIIIISAIAAAAAALGYYIYTILKKRAAMVPAAPAAPRIPAPDRALARLAQLRKMQLFDDESVQRFYVEASSIVREYLEEQLGVRAPEMTTEEFLTAPQTSRLLQSQHRALLSDYLMHCDLVKFARQSSSAAERDRLIGCAERLVQETRQANFSSAEAAVASETAAASIVETDSARVAAGTGGAR